MRFLPRYIGHKKACYAGQSFVYLPHNKIEDMKTMRLSELFRKKPRTSLKFSGVIKHAGLRIPESSNLDKDAMTGFHKKHNNNIGATIADGDKKAKMKYPDARSTMADNKTLPNERPIQKVVIELDTETVRALLKEGVKSKGNLTLAPNTERGFYKVPQSLVLAHRLGEDGMNEGEISGTLNLTGRVTIQEITERPQLSPQHATTAATPDVDNVVLLQRPPSP